MEQDLTIQVRTSMGTEDIHAVRTGSGPRRFLVWHGFNAVNRFYHWRFLQKFGEVVRVGLPGHGPVAPKRWSHYARWSQDHFLEIGVAICRHFYSRLPLVLVGHSLGGHMALGCASRMPQMIGALVLINPLVWSPLGAWIQSLARSPLWRLFGSMALAAQVRRAKASVDGFMESLRGIIGDAESFYGNPNTVAYTKAGHADYRRSHLTALVGAARVAATCDLRPRLRAVDFNVPTLVVHGDRDVVAPIAQSEWLVRRMAAATLIRLRGAGHVCHGEREHEVAELVSLWLGKKLLPAALA